MINKTNGIVLKQIPYQDTNHLVTILTKDGLNSYLVKATKKITSKNNRLIQIGNIIEFQYHENGNNKQLIDGEVKYRFDIINKLANFHQVEIIFDYLLSLNLTINRFDLLHQFLILLIPLMNEMDYPKVLRQIFEIKFLYLLGINPNLDGFDDNKVLSLNEGKLIDYSMVKSDDIVLNNQLTKFFIFIYHLDITKVNEELLEKLNVIYSDLEKFINLFYELYLNYHSKTKEILNNL